MSQPRATIGELLDVASEHVSDTLADHIKQHAAQVGLPEGMMGFVAEEAARAVAGRLQLDVFELVFKAWAAVDELRDFADAGKHPPAEVSIVRWGKCSIKAPQAIDVKLQMAGVALPVLRLTVDIAAQFHSLALTIQGGAIRKLAPGPASASVALKYGGATLIAPRKTPELAFDGGIEFADGLPLA